ILEPTVAGHTSKKTTSEESEWGRLKGHYQDERMVKAVYVLNRSWEEYRHIDEHGCHILTILKRNRKRKTINFVEDNTFLFVTLAACRNVMLKYRLGRNMLNRQ
ncbi:hypothetical protein L9F63_018026, partial [Diploptera punctata]